MLERMYTGRAVLVALLVVAVSTAVIANLFGRRTAPHRPIALIDDPSPGLPGEFNRCSALLLGSRSLVNQNRGVLAEIVAAIDGRMPTVILVDADDTRRGVLSYLLRRGVRTDGLRFVEVPIKEVWLRDFGPIFVHGQDGRLSVIDAIYATGTEPADDVLPRYIAGYFRLPVLDFPLKLEGGNVLSNGSGFSLFTNAVLGVNMADGHTIDDIRQILDRTMPAEQYVFLQPLEGEPTKHVDMFATFVARDQIVVASISKTIDPANASLLDEHADTLGKYRVGDRPLRVTRIPMGRHTDGNWRSYNNVIFANGVLLVPQYGVEPELDAEAVAIYEALLPDWQVVGINAAGLIGKAGSLHCISVNVPYGVPDLQAPLPK